MLYINILARLASSLFKHFFGYFKSQIIIVNFSFIIRFIIDFKKFFVFGYTLFSSLLLISLLSYQWPNKYHFKMLVLLLRILLKVRFIVCILNYLICLSNDSLCLCSKIDVVNICIFRFLHIFF